MKVLEIAHPCLQDILYKEIPFKLAIENTAKKHTIFKEDRKKLSNLVGCSLRHYYVFMGLINKVNAELTNEQKSGLLLYLSDRLFLSFVPSKEVDEFIKSLDINEKDLKAINDLSLDKEKIIPEEFPKDSIEFLNYRYNTPLWVLKLWLKHFKGYSYKIVRANNKPANHYAMVNLSLTNKEELLKQYRELEDSKFDNLVVYKGNVPPLRHSLFKANKLILCNPAEDYLLNKLDLDLFRDIVIYSEYKSDLHIQLMGRLSKNMRLSYIAGASEAYYQVKKDIDEYQLFKTQLFETGHKSIITCVGQKVHTFFVLPKNTNFVEFRNSPDYFNRLKQDELDSLIENQKSALEDASEFVEGGGNLVYMIPTMNKKESLQIISDFLVAHKEFVLEEQKQFLPFDKYDSTLFIAVFRKEAKDD